MLLPLELRAEKSSYYHHLETVKSCDNIPSEESTYQKLAREMTCSCAKKYKTPRFTANAGSTADMIEGAYDYNDCLEAQISKLTKGFFNPNNYSEKKFAKDFDKLIKDYYSLMNKIYFSNKDCAPHCGTLYYSLKIEAVSVLYENTLLEIARMRQGHVMDSSFSTDAPTIVRKYAN